MSCLGDIRRDLEDGCRQPVVAETREAIVGGEGLGEVSAESGLRAQRLGKSLVPSESRSVAERTAKQHVAEADGRDLALREVVQPRRDEGLERRSPRDGPAVAYPQLGVGERIEAFALDHPGIERHRRELDPAPDTVEPVDAVTALPVAQQLRNPSRSEVRPYSPDHLRNQ